MKRLQKLFTQGQASRTIEVAKIAQSHPQTVKMWFGESDLHTPDFIINAAINAMRAGQTFYAPRRGIPELRSAISEYLSGLYKVAVDIERITVTSSGMSAIMVALQAASSAGGNVLVVSPIWPNITNAIYANGAECRHIRLRQTEKCWYLDLNELFGRVDSNTRAIFIATPGNPTGWICEANEQKAILEFCEKKGIYLIADEVYHRIVFKKDTAPSFMSACEPSFPFLLTINSFSKTWAMSGWRLGWMVHPSSAAQCIGDLNAVNSTGAATFVQHAGIEALQNGEPFVLNFVDYCRKGYEMVHEVLENIPDAGVVRPDGAMYSFFSLAGVSDSFTYAKSLARETGIGLAPGPVFGSGNEGFFRMCYALDESILMNALDRMMHFIRKTR